VDITNVNHWSVTETYAVNIPSIVGASTAWFGFTGGGGGGGSYQDVLWWTYGQPQATMSPVAATQTGGLSGVTLNFNRPVNGFNLADLSLTLNGSAVSLATTPLIGTPNGELSYTLANLASLTSAAGTYVLTAGAAGLADAGGNSPASNLTATWTVSKAGDTTAVTSSGTPSVYGQSVTFTATVTPTSGSGETGTVEFIVDGSNATNATLSGNTASYTLTTLGAGTHSISAVYSGDTNFASSSSSNFSQTVSKAQLTVTAASTSRIYGSANPTFADTITGFVNNDPNSVVSGTPNLTTTATTSSGVGTYPINVSQGTLAASNYTFTFTGGTLTVTAATLTVTATNTNKTYGSANPTLADTITGFVNNDPDSVVSGAANLTTTATTSSNVGNYPINVSQGTLSAANYRFTFSAGTLSVTPLATTTVVISSNGSTAYGQSVTFTATVTPNTGAGPTGTVEFVIDGSNASNAALSGNTASYTLSTLTPGSHLITAVYSGDTNFNGSASNAITESVVGAPTLTGSNYLELDPSVAGQLDIWAGTSNSGPPTSTYPVSQLSSLTDSGTGGDASLNLDFTNGSPVPAGGLTFTGGSGDALIVTGSAGDNTASIGGSTLTFDSSTIDLPNVPTVTINTGAGNDSLTQTSQPTAGSVTFNGGTGNDRVDINAGTYSFTADPQPLTSSLSVTASGAGSEVLFNPTSGRSIHLAGLTLSNGASATVESLGGARAGGNQRVLVIGSPGATSAPTFSIDASSQLDLTDDDLVIHDGSLSGTYTLLQSGYNTSAGGYWNGNGITSSAAAADSLTTLGLSQPISAGTYDGETVGTNDVLVKYTYYGDANLDGTVDGLDYSRIDNGYLNHLTGWFNGDFNYDGVINGSDYTLLDNAFNTQGANLAAEVAAVVQTGVKATTAPNPAAQYESAAARINPIAKPASLISEVENSISAGRFFGNVKAPGTPLSSWSQNVLAPAWQEGWPTSSPVEDDLLVADAGDEWLRSPFSLRLVQV
jgi:hypothetical protein